VNEKIENSPDDNECRQDIEMIRRWRRLTEVKSFGSTVRFPGGGRRCAPAINITFLAMIQQQSQVYVA
jgi:hypothetical protein